MEGDAVCVGDTLDERVEPVNRRGYKRKIIHQRIELAMVLLTIGLPCSDCDCRAELYERDVILREQEKVVKRQLRTGVFLPSPPAPQQCFDQSVAR